MLRALVLASARVALVCTVTASCLGVSTAAADPPSGPSRTEVVIELYGREGCPHCAAAHAYLRELERRRTELRVRSYDVGKDPAALDRLRTRAAQAGVQAAVPAFHVRGRLFVGFDSAATTGRTLQAWLDAGRQSASVPGTCSPEEPCPEPSPSRSYAMRVPFFGELDVRDLGLPLFTLAIGLVDGFNPCAMWVLLFVLSMLVHLKDRGRMALIGGTFVLVSALVYFAFMAAWLNFFVLIGVSRPVQIALGAVAIAMGAVHIKDFFAFHKGLSLSIPEAAKPGIYRRVREVLHAERLGGALAAVIVLAAMVNLVELLCTAGLPALYTQVLTSQRLPAVSYYGYLALYNAAYMLDDAAMLTVALVTLSQHKLQERGGRLLKLVSGAVMAALGLLLVFKPEWLS